MYLDLPVKEHELLAVNNVESSLEHLVWDHAGCMLQTLDQLGQNERVAAPTNPSWEEKIMDQSGLRRENN